MEARERRTRFRGLRWLAPVVGPKSRTLRACTKVERGLVTLAKIRGIKPQTVMRRWMKTRQLFLRGFQKELFLVLRATTWWRTMQKRRRNKRERERHEQLERYHRGFYAKGSCANRKATMRNRKIGGTRLHAFFRNRMIQLATNCRMWHFLYYKRRHGFTGTWTEMVNTLDEVLQDEFEDMIRTHLWEVANKNMRVDCNHNARLENSWL